MTSIIKSIASATIPAKSPLAPAHKAYVATTTPTIMAAIVNKLPDKNATTPANILCMVIAPPVTKFHVIVAAVTKATIVLRATNQPLVIADHVASATSLASVMSNSALYIAHAAASPNTAAVITGIQFAIPLNTAIHVSPTPTIRVATPVTTAAAITIALVRLVTICRTKSLLARWDIPL